jgi:hypothetical protein
LAYTIGLRETLGGELVFAGGSRFLAEDVLRIIDELARRVGASPGVERWPVLGSGAFRLAPVAPSWSKHLLPGANDYYGIEAVAAWQIVPDQDHLTVDVPDMSVELDGRSEPVWQWLDARWPHEIAGSIGVTTNMDAPRGEPITELTRWEADEWEMFSGAGPEVLEADLRVVPLATLIGFDPSLALALAIEVGTGLWREDGQSEWNEWRSSSE